MGELFIEAGIVTTEYTGVRLSYKSKAIQPLLSTADWKTNTGGGECELMVTFRKARAPYNLFHSAFIVFRTSLTHRTPPSTDLSLDRGYLCLVLMPAV